MSSCSTVIFRGFCFGFGGEKERGGVGLVGEQREREVVDGNSGEWV